MGIDDSRDGADQPGQGAPQRVVRAARGWFLDQLRPGTLDYLLPLALRVRGGLQTDALLGALTAVVERHEVLRASYRQDAGRLLQPHRSPSRRPLAGTRLHRPAGLRPGSP
ncbi:condensation domain-containing protein, partial [Streptomyces achromogenes]|uniref:condensation domain-containing protein n=1 Tax=Streptomyces achromogenes TaxID=67255 RepID=UPI0037D0538F